MIIIGSIKMFSFTSVDIEDGVGRAVSNKTSSKRDQPNSCHDDSHGACDHDSANDEGASDNNSECAVIFSDIVFHCFLAPLREVS
jgi:hypothetical protein